MSDFAPRFTITNAITAGLTAIERARGFLLERRFPEINRRTLQRDLKVMLDEGLVREVGTGPTDPNRHYVVGNSLPGKL